MVVDFGSEEFMDMKAWYVSVRTDGCEVWMSGWYPANSFEDSISTALNDLGLDGVGVDVESRYTGHTWRRLWYELTGGRHRDN